MPRHRYQQIDVFSPRRGLGNPLGVVFDADDLDGTAMQRIAAWLNLSETIFFLCPQAPGADYRIRIFTPGGELPFAGHPSVGAAWVMATSGAAAPHDGALVQECAAGLLPVRLHDGAHGLRPSVRSPSARRLPGDPPSLPASLAAIVRDGTQPEPWSNGPQWWLLEVRDAAGLDALVPDLPAIAALPGSGKLAAFALGDEGDSQLAVRAFAPGIGVAEDPATGSANALIAAMLQAQGRLPGRDGRYVARQGRVLGRDARIGIEVDAEGEVWIGGAVQPVIDGRIDW